MTAVGQCKFPLSPNDCSDHSLVATSDASVHRRDLTLWAIQSADEPITIRNHFGKKVGFLLNNGV